MSGDQGGVVVEWRGAGGKNSSEAQESLGSDRHVYFLDFGDGLMGIYLY